MIADRKLVRIRKSERNDPMQDTRKLMSYARTASSQAIRKQLESGISVVYAKGDNLVEHSADGEKKVIRSIKPKKPFDLRAYLCQDSD